MAQAAGAVGAGAGAAGAAGGGGGFDFASLLQMLPALQQMMGGQGQQAQVQPMQGMVPSQQTQIPTTAVTAPQSQSGLGALISAIGGGPGDDPDARQRYLETQGTASLLTALGGAIAGPNSTVGRVSGVLNAYHQGNIGTINAQNREKNMNTYMQAAMGAFGGGTPHATPPTTSATGSTPTEVSALGSPLSLSFEDLDARLAALSRLA